MLDEVTGAFDSHLVLKTDQVQNALPRLRHDRDGQPCEQGHRPKVKCKSGAMMVSQYGEVFMPTLRLKKRDRVPDDFLQPTDDPLR